MSDTELDITTLENWLWDAACKIGVNHLGAIP